MQRFFVTVFLLIAVSFFALPASAKELKMLFWYPGEAGSTEEAAPVLDGFFQYISKKISPDHLTGKYFNSDEGGKVYLKRVLPDLGIVSYMCWKRHKESIPAAVVWLATAPLPHGKTVETYILIGRQRTFPPKTSIFIDETLSPEFISAELFPRLPADVHYTSTNQLFEKLRKLGEGSQEGFALLTPLEAATLAHLKAPWAQQLQTLSTSPPIPTPRVILLNQHLVQAEKIKKILLDMGSDPAAQDILEQLRLKGFAPAT